VCSNHSFGRASFGARYEIARHSLAVLLNPLIGKYLVSVGYMRASEGPLGM
jgi:hypothetical protein